MRSASDADHGQGNEHRRYADGEVDHALHQPVVRRIDVATCRKTDGHRREKSLGAPSAGLKQQHTRRRRGKPCRIGHAVEICLACGDNEFDLVAIQACRIFARSYVADRPQAKLGNCGKQKAGLLDRGAAASKGRWSSPQAAPDESVAGQGLGVIAEKKDQSPLARGRKPNV